MRYRRWALALGLLALATRPAAAQVALGAISGQITYQSGTTPVTGWVAYFDVSNGARFRPAVTHRASPACTTSPGTVRLLQTNEFAEKYGTLVAITANAGPELGNDYKDGLCGTPDGLIVSNGQHVNPAQLNGPVLFFDRVGHPMITGGTLPTPAIIRDAVAGPASIGGATGGTLLVRNGQPGGNPLPAPTSIAPRGAIGLDAARRTLIVAIVQGDESEGVGLQNADFAKLMIGLGAWNAVNFDGGGSTAFLWNPKPGHPPTLSRPLVKELQAAAFPSNQSNPFKLVFKAVPVADITQPVVSDSQHNNGTNFRAIYASFGLLF